MKSLAIISAVLLLVVAGACARSGSGAARPRGDMNLITREQLAEHRFSTAYDAVQSLRSNWLTARGTDSFRSPSQVLVYYDDVKLGGVETLRTINIASVSYIQHFDGLTATQRWGLDHGAGVIYVSTRPSRSSRARYRPPATLSTSPVIQPA